MVKIISENNNKKPYHTKSRKQFECPENLKNFLDKINLVEPSVTLFPCLEVITDVRGENPELNELEVGQASLSRCFEILPTALRAYFYEAVANDLFDSVIEQIKRYEDFRLSRIKLSRLPILKNNLAAINQDFGGIGNLEIDSKGIAHITLDSFAQAIDGVEVDRIRSCEICERIFWAGNKNSKACSQAHAANLRNRKSRKVNKERRNKENKLVNEKRRRNYDYNKKLMRGK